MNFVHHLDIPQGGADWFAIRRGRLTGSKFASVLGRRYDRKLHLIDGEKPDFGRAKAQEALFDQLKEAGENGILLSKIDSDSARKALVEKGVAVEKEDTETATIKEESAMTLIDELLEQLLFSDEELGGIRPPSFEMVRGSELEPVARFEFETKSGMNVTPCGFFMREDLPLCGASPDGLVDDGGIFETKCPMPKTHLGYLRAYELPAEYRAQVHGQLAVTGAPHCWFVSYCPKLPTLILKIERTAYTDSILPALLRFEGLYSSQLQMFGIQPRQVAAIIQRIDGRAAA